MKSTKHFAFTTPLPPDDLLARLPLELDAYASEHRLRDGLLFKKTEDGFRIGLGQAGHSHGDWYFATMERAGDVTYIQGEIKTDPPYESDNQPKWKTVLDWIGIGFLALLCAIPILVIWLVFGVKSLIRKLRGLPRELTREEILVDFMTTRMGCTPNSPPQ